MASRGGSDAALWSKDRAEKAFADISRHNIVSTAGVDKEGRQVVVFSACRLPPKEDIDHDRLLLYVLHTLNGIVESDYTFVYFHHGFHSNNKPGMKWLLRMYSALDRSYKKNVKKMLIVHPTSFIKIMLTAFKPVVSAKFGRKIALMSRLAELAPYVYMEQLDIPDDVRRHDAKVGGGATATASLPDEPLAMGAGPGRPNPRHVFGVPLDVLVKRYGTAKIPFLLDVARHIRRTSIQQVGIFRRSGKKEEFEQALAAINNGKAVDFAQLDPNIPPSLLKRFFRDLPEPILTDHLYQPIAEGRVDYSSPAHLGDLIDLVKTIPKDNQLVLIFLLDFLVEVASHSDVNRMTTENLSIVFGPNLLYVAAPIGINGSKRINACLTHLMDSLPEVKRSLGS